VHISWLPFVLLRSSLFLDITQRSLLINYRRFGTTYRSCLQGRNSFFYLNLGKIHFHEP